MVAVHGERDGQHEHAGYILVELVVLRKRLDFESVLAALLKPLQVLLALVQGLQILQLNHLARAGPLQEVVDVLGVVVVLAGGVLRKEGLVE